MNLVKWRDFFGQEHILMEGKNDDVFHVIPDKKDDEGNSYTKILSKKAMIEFVEMLKKAEEISCANCGGREVLEKGDYCDLCEEK